MPTQEPTKTQRLQLTGVIEGPPGPKGDPGKSAYQTAVQNGFEGTEQEWLASLKGDKGETGEPGPPGQNGSPGENGENGEKGERGEPGETPHIGENGNWFIGETDTGKPSRGEKGEIGSQGINLILDSDVELKTSTVDVTKTMDSDILRNIEIVRGKNISISAEIDLQELIAKSENVNKRCGIEIQVQMSDDTINYYGVSFSLSDDAPITVKKLLAKSVYIPIKVVSIKYIRIYIQGVASGTAIIRRPKIEIGEVENPVWTPAPQDLVGPPGESAEVDPTLTQPDQAAEAKATGDKILQYAIKNTVTSANPLTVEDSTDEYLQGLRLFGKTEQKTTTGAQLLDIGPIGTELKSADDNVFGIVTTNGIYATAKIADDSQNTDIYFAGRISLDGLITNYEELPWLIPGITYTAYNNSSYYKFYIVCKKSDSEPVEVLVNISNSTSDFTVKEGYKYRIFIRPLKQAVNLQRVIQPMIIKKTNIPISYESYTGGKSSPSPDYPQELEASGKDGNIAMKLTNGSTAVSLGMVYNRAYNFACTTTIKTSLSTYIRPGQKMIVILPQNIVRYIRAVKIQDTNSTNINSNLVAVNGANNVVVTLNKTLHPIDNNVFFFEINGSNLNENEAIEITKSKILIVPGESTQSLTLPTPNGLPGIKVSTGGNYTDPSGQQWVCDEIDLKRGVYVQRVKQFTLDGTEGWYKPTNDEASGDFYKNVCRITDLKMIDVGLQGTYTGIMSSHFKGCTWSYVNNNIHETGISLAFSLEPSKTGVSIFSPIFPTPNSLKEWLTKNPVNCIAAMETPIETPLSEELLQEFRALKTYYPHTNIINDANVDMELTYAADTKLYSDNLFEKLRAELTNTQVQLL